MTKREGAGPPDFVGVGAQRCGTSWWFSLLLEHPEVAWGSKELHYFDRFDMEEFGTEEITGYHAMFSPMGAQLRGEWTPRYMHDFWTPGLLARAAPEVRLLAIVRDPVARYRSAARFGNIVPGQPRRTGPQFADDVLDRGRYHKQLKRLLDYFPREQLLILQYEQCIAAPLRLYRRTLSHLGLKRFDPGEKAFGTRVNPSTLPSLLPAHIPPRLIEEFREDVERLRAEFPEVDVDLWPDFSA